MQQQNVNYLGPVAQAPAETRSEFIWKCYAHVVGGILAFAAVSAYLFQSGAMLQIAQMVQGNWWLFFWRLHAGQLGCITPRYAPREPARSVCGLWRINRCMGAHVHANAVFCSAHRRARKCYWRDHTRLRRPHCYRNDYPQGFLIPARHAYLGLHAGACADYLISHLRLSHWEHGSRLQ